MGILDGKVALITGAASGQGAAAARCFAAEGGRVAVTDIDSAGEQVAAAIGEEQAAFMALDVRSAQAWQQVVEDTISRFGRLDVLVNNAGVFRLASFEQTTDEIFNQVFDVNQRGVFNGMRAVLPQMQKAGGGCIINIRAC